MGLPPKEGVFVQAARELVRNGSLSDATFRAVEHLVGPAQTIDLIVLVGYYSMLGKVLVLARRGAGRGGHGRPPGALVIPLP